MTSADSTFPIRGFDLLCTSEISALLAMYGRVNVPKP